MSHNSRFYKEHLPNCILCLTVSKGVIHKSCPKAADAPHAAAWEREGERERGREGGEKDIIKIYIIYIYRERELGEDDER